MPDQPYRQRRFVQCSIIYGTAALNKAADKARFLMTVIR